MSHSRLCNLCPLCHLWIILFTRFPMSLTQKTAAELVALQAAGQATAADITDAFLAAIRDRDPKVKAFLFPAETEAWAREQAAAVDAKRKAGKPLGRLAGVPVAVKDVLCTKGVR